MCWLVWGKGLLENCGGSLHNPQKMMKYKCLSFIMDGNCQKKIFHQQSWGKSSFQTKYIWRLLSVCCLPEASKIQVAEDDTHDVFDATSH